ncbi:MAG: PQQ-binding-like beta-propeller repeat protein, partial [Planctomycetota bacterium]
AEKSNDPRAKILFTAAREGNVTQIKKLLDEGLDVNSGNAYGATALMFACSKGQKEVVELLLERGADPNLKDTFYSATAMAWAAMKQQQEISMTLLKAGCKDVDTALMLAAMASKAEDIKMIREEHEPSIASLRRVKNMPQMKADENLRKLFEDVEDALAQESPGKDTEPETKEPTWKPSAEELERYAGSYVLYPQDDSEIATFEENLKLAKDSGDWSKLSLAQISVNLGALSIQRDDTDASLTDVEKNQFKFAESTFVFEMDGEQAIALVVKADEAETRFRRLETENEIAAGSAESLAADLAVSSSDWPQFRGLGARGVAEGQNPPTHWNVPENKNVLWKTPVEGLAHSCPIILGDKLFITTAISDEDQAGLRTGLYGDVDSVEDNSEHRFEVHCYNKNDGKLIWKQLACTAAPKVKRHLKSTHANPTPATDGEYVVAFFGSEGLYCYTVDGEFVWKRDFGLLDSGWFFDSSFQWGFAASPIIFEDKVYIQCDIQEGSFVVALDISTGKDVWRVAREEIPAWATPSVLMTETGPQLVTNATNYARSYDPSTGEEIWRIGKNSEIACPTPFLAHGLIYVASGYRPIRPVYAIRPTAKGDISIEIDSKNSPSIAWSNQRSAPYMTTPVVYGDYFYTCNSAGVLECLNAKTGKRIYRKRIATSEATSFIAALLAADGHIYLPSEEGITLVIKAGPEYELVAENPTGESLHATPAISDGVIYLRSQGHLIAIKDGASKRSLAPATNVDERK